MNIGVDVGIMIEGQMGLNWHRWQRLVRAVEDLGFVGLWRSDHFTNRTPPDMDSLELWTSLTWLADNTSRIEFGPLVTPMSFRHPVWTARMAKEVDDLSGGRLVLGVGAGWQEREHRMFGFPLLSVSERFARLEEGVQVILHLLRDEDSVAFRGRFYHLEGAILLPRPARPGGPRLLVGGNGIRRTLPLAARYADEWNGVYLKAEEFERRNRLLDELLHRFGRDPKAVRRSLMIGLEFGPTEAALREKLAGRDVEALRARGVLVGTGHQIQEQMAVLAEAGVQRVMLQWLDLDDLDGLEALAKAVL
jgi:probable F420-dependent oxidoreductase, Rv1855c family